VLTSASSGPGAADARNVRLANKMDFVLTITCEHGTTNPIVARLSVQSRQLMEPFRIRRDRADTVWSIIHNKIQPELLNCYDIWIQVANDETRIIAHVEEEGIKTQSNGRVATIETIPKLNDSAKAFLYAAHASLRGCVKSRSNRGR